MPRRLLSNLTVQVLAAVAVGILIGALRPDWGVALKPVGDGFIRLVRCVVAPVIFLTIVGGIAGMGDLRRVGRVGLKALIYFEVVTTVALAIGLLVANLARPGEGVSTASATAAAAGEYAAKPRTFAEHLLGVIPESVLGPFVSGDALQVLFLAILVGIAVATLAQHGGGTEGAGEARRAWIIERIEWLTDLMFRIVAIIMRLAPLGALGAMAYTIGRHGAASLLPLMKLMACVYLTMAAFILLVLGAVLWLCGVSLWRYLVYIREEILLVLGTSSSESALPRMIQKMRRAGCGCGGGSGGRREGDDVAGLVIPAGYSFNLDGTSIYLSMAVLFIAQAYGVPMSLGQQVYVLAVLMLTSKGAAAVTGGGFVTLAATLTATHVLPIEGLALLLGVDRFMSEARAITNLIGNGVAAIAVSQMEGVFDAERFRVASNPAPLITSR